MDESTVSLFKAAACFSCKNLSSINWKPHFFKYESKIQLRERLDKNEEDSVASI